MPGTRGFLREAVSSGPGPDVYVLMDENGSQEGPRARQFSELFAANYGLVLAYARRRVGADLAQDVVADTFLAAWRNMDDLPPEPLPWLYRAAHYAVAGHRRTLARRGRLDDRARLQAPSVTAPDHAELVAADMELAAAFRALSEADREVLRLAAWEGLGPEAIGAVVGCSGIAAKARLYRARRRLSQRLGTATSQLELYPLARETAIKETGI
jgi:RNA polymerase sigma-70 factor (ECF subfamily)